MYIIDQTKGFCETCPKLVYNNYRMDERPLDKWANSYEEYMDKLILELMVALDKSLTDKDLNE